VTARWRVAGSRTTLTRLRLTGVPARARVQVRCTGRGCPFAVRRAKAPRRGVVDALAALTRRQRTLRAGQRLEVRVTETGKVGKVVRYAVRRGRPPAPATLCLPPGSGAAKRAC
jgi:hypothetical protein